MEEKNEVHRYYSLHQYIEDKIKKNVIDYKTPFIFYCYGCGKDVPDFDLFNSGNNKYLTKDGYCICNDCNEKEINKLIRFNSLNGD